MNRLGEILEVKRAEVAQLRPRRAALHRRALERNDVRSLRAVLRRPDARLALIAEVKKASPSAGVIVESFAPVEIAQNYERAGAEAISVLTDEKFFQGHLDYLEQVRSAVALPVLRKDFIIDEVQIMEAAIAGADAILLIVAALEQEQLVGLLKKAALYQLEVLTEVHSLPELERALETDAQIIGINNRNLGTLTIDLAVTERLSEEVPNELILVSESGIKNVVDLQRIKACGVDAVLIGEALMRAQNGTGGSLLTAPR